MSEICSIPVAGKADPSSWLKALPYDASDHAPLLDEIISITRNILSVEEPCNSLLVLLDRNLER